MKIKRGVLLFAFSFFLIFIFSIDSAKALPPCDKSYTLPSFLPFEGEISIIGEQDVVQECPACPELQKTDCYSIYLASPLLNSEKAEECSKYYQAVKNTEGKYNYYQCGLVPQDTENEKYNLPGKCSISKTKTEVSQDKKITTTTNYFQACDKNKKTGETSECPIEYVTSRGINSPCNAQDNPSSKITRKQVCNEAGSLFACELVDKCLKWVYKGACDFLNWKPVTEQPKERCENKQDGEKCKTDKGEDGLCCNKECEKEGEHDIGTFEGGADWAGGAVSKPSQWFGDRIMELFNNDPKKYSQEHKEFLIDLVDNYLNNPNKYPKLLWSQRKEDGNRAYTEISIKNFEYTISNNPLEHGKIKTDVSLLFDWRDGSLMYSGIQEKITEFESKYGSIFTRIKELLKERQKSGNRLLNIQIKIEAKKNDKPLIEIFIDSEKDDKEIKDYTYDKTIKLLKDLPKEANTIGDQCENPDKTAYNVVTQEATDSSGNKIIGVYCKYVSGIITNTYVSTADGEFNYALKKIIVKKPNGDIDIIMFGWYDPALNKLAKARIAYDQFRWYKNKLKDIGEIEKKIEQCKPKSPAIQTTQPTTQEPPKSPCPVFQIIYEGKQTKQIETLREIRDKVLKKSILGNAIIDFHYSAAGSKIETFAYKIPPVKSFMRQSLDYIAETYEEENQEDQ